METCQTDLEALAAWLRAHGIETELRVLPPMSGAGKLAVSIFATIEFGTTDCGFEPHQILATGDHGKISVRRGTATGGDFEIYCLEGDLFDDIRRYRDVAHAGKTIASLVGTGMFDETVPRVHCRLESLFGTNDGGDGPTQEEIR